MKLETPRLALAVTVLLGLTSGCDRKPQRAEVPGHNPSSAASAAMAKYDANADGAIAGDELQKVPALIDHPDLAAKLDLVRSPICRC